MKVLLFSSIYVAIVFLLIKIKLKKLLAGLVIFSIFFVALQLFSLLNSENNLVTNDKINTEYYVDTNNFNEKITNIFGESSRAFYLDLELYSNLVIEATIYKNNSVLLEEKYYTPINKEKGLFKIENSGNSIIDLTVAYFENDTNYAIIRNQYDFFEKIDMEDLKKINNTISQTFSSYDGSIGDLVKGEKNSIYKMSFDDDYNKNEKYIDGKIINDASVEDEMKNEDYYIEINYWFE